MNPIEVFIEFLRQALIKVDNDYYGLHWWNDSMLNATMGEVETKQRKAVKELLDRYGERVFCYELYHQIRVLMDNHHLHNPRTFENVKLQSELKKDYIGQIVQEYFNVEALDSEYIPDFLLHTLGNFDNQFLIIEVKSNPQLSFSGMKDDLLKIQQFITRYHYKKGVFLTINTNPDRIKNALEVEANKDWLRMNIANPERITVMCKKKNDVPLYETSISALIENNQN